MSSAAEPPTERDLGERGTGGQGIGERDLGERGTGEPGQSGAFAVLRRGLRLSPELTRGLGPTLLLALTATAGRVVVPVAVQQTIDRGLLGPGGPRPGFVLACCLGAVGGLVLTGLASYLTNYRLFRSAEAGLATLRARAFRHVHDLSVLTRNTERTGSLVSRVTSDVDTISSFVQFGGLLLIMSAGQLVVATVVMALYSWPLALLVWACFLPMFAGARPLQRRVSVAYARERERVGAMLAAVSESVLGAETIRAYAVRERTQRRVDDAVDAYREAAMRAQTLVATAFTGGVLVSGLVVAAVVVLGTWLGTSGYGAELGQPMTLGRLLAVLFLVQIFTGPVQMVTEVLNELQNALAGWRRVLEVLDTPIDVADPGEHGTALPPGPPGVRFERVDFAYPGGPPVLREVDLELPAGARVAVVGRTGSGKTTLATLLVRLADPAAGRVLLSGVDVRRVPFEQLRTRVTLVPQTGFLFEASLVDNILWGRAGATRRDAEAALDALGLSDWIAGLPHGLETGVGQRGESLSAGERQLVSLARAQVAGPDLLVLDEATSAVDPATEVRLQRALDGVASGRTTVSIAHRLSTAARADLVVVVDAGRVVDVGPHRELLGRCQVYERLYASWSSALATR